MKKIIHLVLQLLIIFTTYILGSVYIQMYWLVYLPSSMVVLFFSLLAFFRREKLSLFMKISCLVFSLFVYLPAIEFLGSLCISHNVWAIILVVCIILLIIANLMYWLIIEMVKKKGNLGMYSSFLIFSSLVMIVSYAYFLHLLYA